jgi:2-polyprenyl-3-methyl-5-hydroxy-6-metoxy-1,4-benzoquinol methylase
MTPLLPKQYSKVLEIGCGEGNFRENLSLEHEYWGVEQAESAAAVASAKLDKVLTGSYQEMFDQIPNDYFDLVICNDIIEHMVDHSAFLLSIKKKIKEDGCLVVSVPNVRYLPNLFEILVKKDWDYRKEGVLDRTHLRFFTKKSLHRIITNNGFIIDESIGINPFRANSALRRCLFFFVSLILGRDIMFLQFGVRVHAAEPAEKSPQPTAANSG